MKEACKDTVCSAACLPVVSIRSARKLLETLPFAHLSLTPPVPECPLPRCVGVWQNDRVEIIANEQVSRARFGDFVGVGWGE